MDSLFNHIYECFVDYLDAAIKGETTSAEGFRTEFAAELVPQSMVRKAVKPAVNASGFFGSHIPAKEFINREAPRKMFYDTFDGA